MLSLSLQPLQQSMTDCLRSVPVSVLMSAGALVSPPEHLTAFGPILDGVVVVPVDPRPLHQSALLNQMTSSSSSSLSSSSSSSNAHNQQQHLLPLPPRAFDLLVGATTADGPCLFSEEERTKGLEAGRRAAYCQAWFEMSLTSTSSRST